MPLWDIHTVAGLFTPEEKQHLAKSITAIYTRIPIPKFYVHCRFQEHEPINIYSGGENQEIKDRPVLIQIWHLARTMDSAERKQRFLNNVDKVLTPFLESKGLDWEYTVMKADRDLWKINEMYPPATGSDMEKQWIEADRPVKVGQ